MAEPEMTQVPVRALGKMHDRIATMEAALRAVIRVAEAAKEPVFGMDPESPAAIRNGKFASIAQVAAQGLGWCSGPALDTYGVPEVQPQRLTVWFGAMPESNGKANWTAILHRGDMCEGFTVARSEYHDRVRYEADCVRHLIGELPERPDILAYDPDMLSPKGWTHPCGVRGTLPLADGSVLREGEDYDRTRGVPVPRTYLHPTRVDALIAVLEGECDGLAVSRETAEAILHYLDGNAPPHGVPEVQPPDLSEILSGETMTQREEVCAAWADLPDDLRKDPRLDRLYRALGGPRMDDPTEADTCGVPGLGDMRAEFKAWVEDRGCDTDGAWSAWQGCWNLLHTRSVKVGCANCGKELAGANSHDCKPIGVGGNDGR